MEIFDFNAPAEIFFARSMGSRKQPVTYHRFAAGSEAIRYAMEVLAADKLGGTVLESGDDRYDAKEIRRLYDSADYPLPRADQA